MRQRVKSRSRREIPAVNKVLDALGEYDLPRPLVVDLVRRGLSKIRSNSEIPEFESTVERLHRSLELLRASRLQPVINGTGIVIHTNFGRAPLTSEAVRALTEIGSGYSNLEYDLATGDRGHRGAYIENALALLCGAEAATVINNCAAALVLIVHHFIEQKLDGFKPSSFGGEFARVWKFFQDRIVARRFEIFQRETENWIQPGAGVHHVKIEWRELVAEMQFWIIIERTAAVIA